MKNVLLATVVLGTLGTVRLPSIQAEEGRRVHNLKVLSDQVDDVTTVDNILKAFTRPGMTDQERARGLWTSVLKYRHQTAPPNEFLAGDWEACTTLRRFSMFMAPLHVRCCTSALIEAPQPGRWSAGPRDAS